MMTLPIFTDAEIDKEIEFINHSSKFRLSPLVRVDDLVGIKVHNEPFYARAMVFFPLTGETRVVMWGDIHVIRHRGPYTDFILSQFQRIKCPCLRKLFILMAVARSW
jgi:hypothetical protein